MFLGTHDGKVEGGRIVLPAAFRAAMPKGEESVLVYCSYDLACLEGGPLARTQERLTARIADQPPQVAKFLRHAVFSRAMRLTPDAKGRAVLGEGLAAHAGLGEAARFVGLGEYFQIWDPARLDAYAAGLAADAGALAGVDLWGGR